MSKVFRLYQGGADTYQGWNESPAFPYNSNSRDTIDDPDGASAKNEITSIPSPFARIDLVKTAFNEVCRRASKDIKELDGSTIFHKMVSDTLDTGEIFFNIDKYKDKVEIITWDAAQSIAALMNDGNPNHLYVADALQKYLISDASTYNFGQLKNIYLLNYKEGPNELNIIGATSPATLFFSGANDLSYVNDIFFSNNDKPFDNGYQPLYKRGLDYIKAWWFLRKSTPNFSSLFPEIEEYLKLTYQAIPDRSIKNSLDAISPTSASDFQPIDVQAHQQSNQVEVLGYNLYKKKNEVKGTSEFALSPSFPVSETLPLVLPIEDGNKYADLQYVNGKWGKTNKAEYKVVQGDLSQRVLPYDGAQHPYLTISDFLEDTIVRVPHALNTKLYYNGAYKPNEQRESFLLPIKPIYFKYFDVETLRGNMADGKPAFIMESVAGGSIKVVIRIPIVGNNTNKYIEYQRIYYSQRQADISATTNEGGMTSFDFTGNIMPSMRFSNDAEAYYTVSCISTFSSRYDLKFYKKDEAIGNVPVDCRNKVEGVHAYKAETYTIQQTNFDYIRVSDHGNYGGILVPSFAEHQNLDTYEFAIDLGTSNTHIEYKRSGDTQSRAFDYAENEATHGLFFTPSYRKINGDSIQLDLKNEAAIIPADFLPESIGKGTDFSFPTRTALTCAKCTNWEEQLRPFGLVNFNVSYNKRANFDYNSKPLTNIKWSNEPNAQAAMSIFIENVLLMIRNKVVANNGIIAKTQITWFYPSSMSPRRLTQLRDAWNGAYTKMFDREGSTSSMSESVAPIQFYFRRYATATNLVNIDIGGGTTDVAFSSNGTVNYITSFKFAANCLFEDSFSEINPNNGIIDWFKGDILSLLKSRSGLNDLVNIFNTNLGQPSNMASFLFSLKDNSATKALSAQSIDFNKILQNDTKFKIVFIIFYTAIIYHVAQTIKAKGLVAPRHIAFSGNGSKVINTLSSDPKILARYTKTIFELILGKENVGTLEILGFQGGNSSKESTCKGGLIGTTSIDADIAKIVLLNSYGREVANDDRYAAISDALKSEIVRSVKDFFDFTLKELPSKFNLDDNFGVDPTSLQIAIEECDKDLDTYLNKGTELSIQESGNADNMIEDALSFYPIKGAIQALSTRLQEYYNMDE